MIAAIEQWQMRPPWFQFIPIGAVTLGVVLLIVVLLYALS
jgi:hypothetical protein